MPLFSNQNTKTMERYGTFDEVRIISDNLNYLDYEDEILTVVDAYESEEDHPGYDAAVGGQLMDLKDSKGELLPFSLYDWEVERA